MTEVINLINYFSSYFFASGSSARELALTVEICKWGKNRSNDANCQKRVDGRELCDAIGESEV